MTARRRVAVSQRVDRWPARNEVRDAVDQALVRWLYQAGSLPVPVPNGLPQAGLGVWLEQIAPEAIVLSGGNDIGEAPERDRTEGQILAYAEAHRLPVLGICRGMHMLAAYAGGTLESVEGHAGTRHALRIRNGTTGWPAEVNSFHNHGLRSPPPGYAVAAEAPDGTVEAVLHLDLPWEGWMWHPEREATPVPSDIGRFINLLSKSPSPSTKGSL